MEGAQGRLNTIRGAVLALAAVAAGPAPVGAQTNGVLTLQGPYADTAVWGSRFPLTASLGGDCGGTVSTSPMATQVVNVVPAPVVAASSVSLGSLPCSGGRFNAATALDPTWFTLDADWQAFQSNVTLGPATSVVRSPVLGLRFTSEFITGFGGNPLAMTIASGATGYASCTGRYYEVLDRESMGIPAPPPFLRTQFEMFRATTGQCDSGAPQLVNVRLPGSYDEAWVYDSYALGTPAWRRLVESCATPPCAADTLYFNRFERGANVQIHGNGAGAIAHIAFAVNQQDLRGSDLQDMWWAGPSESGWGLTIAKKDDRLFVAGFIYDDAGKPTWVYMPSGQWDPVRLVWYGDLYTPSGAWFGRYNTSLLEVGASIGTGSLSFENGNKGHFDYTLRGLTGGKAIARYEFAARGDFAPKYAGIWWGGPGQDGWGLSVAQQGTTVFATWYTYDSQGKATWFFMPAGQQTAAGTFKGDLYRTTGAAWAGKHYAADATKVVRVGTMELRLGDDVPGMTATVDGVTVDSPLQRFAF